MKRAKNLLFTVGAVAVLPLMASACGSSGGGSPSVTCTNGTVIANEMNDYTFSSQITLPTVKVKSMSDITFNWGGVTTDFLGHPVNPVTDLNTIFLLVVDVPIANFQKQLNDDTFSQGDIVITPPPTFSPTGATSGSLFSNFTVGGETIDITNAAPYLNATTYTPANSTYTIAAQTGANLGTGIRMLQAFQLDDSSTNTTVTLTNSSMSLKYSADLHSLHPTGVPANTAALSMDWGQLTTNALGANITNTVTNITSAIVGHYTQTPAELETQFLNLRTIAQDLYTAQIESGTSLDFTTLMDSAGNPFPGVDSTGTWLVALICDNCRNPAPWYLTILEPAPQPCATK
jgi:hypothetical protein